MTDDQILAHGRMAATVMAEAARAQDRFGDFASAHEAYGVLAEEVAELFEAVRMKQGERPPAGPCRQEAIRQEAIQVAAVALRLAEQAWRFDR